MPRKLDDLTGRTFGLLTVTKPTRVSGAQSYWLCQCECGNEKEARRSHLIGGNVKSCGCATSRLMSENGSTHGHWKGGKSSPEYSAWILARARCHHEDHHAFKDYGARGIVMCDRWRFGRGRKSGFEYFLRDMGLRPDGMTLDRIDNNGPYSPENCRWVSQKEQTRNRRSNRLVTVDGETMCVAEAAEKYGIPYYLAINRIRRGWSPDRAFKEKAGRYRRD